MIVGSSPCLSASTCQVVCMPGSWTAGPHGYLLHHILACDDAIPAASPCFHLPATVGSALILCALAKLQLVTAVLLLGPGHAHVNMRCAASDTSYIVTCTLAPP